MSKDGIYYRITKLTLRHLGRSIHPHLFRDCAATSLAIEDPRHVRIAASLLGHRRFRTTERFYIQARNIEASRIMQKFLLSLRRAAGTRRDLRRPPIFGTGGLIRSGSSLRRARAASVARG